MMAANYRHIGDRENRLGRHYSRFSPFWPTPALSGQSLALRKLCDAGSNRRSQAKPPRDRQHLLERGTWCCRGNQRRRLRRGGEDHERQHFQLIVAAILRALVWTPAQELRGMSEPISAVTRGPGGRPSRL